MYGGGFRRLRKSRSCGLAVRPTSGPAGWRGSSAAPARRSGRCSTSNGLSRRPRAPRQTYRRYEWSPPGALLHMDVKKLARFSVPGHRVTGDRSTKDLHRGIGYDHLHCVVDDRSRIAYVELHPREDAQTNLRTLERALRFFAELGCDPPEAVMTDNAMVYRNSRRFRELLTSIGAHHILIPAYTPAGTAKSNASSAPCKTNGPTPTAGATHIRARALLSYLRYYNNRRPHSSLGDRPPNSRVHNLCGQDT